MANQKAVSMTIGVPGVEIMIWYNDVNRRIGSIEWNIPEPGLAARLQVWDSNVSEVDPVIDRTEGQGSGAENIPGNYQMVEIDDPDIGTYLGFPPNITYSLRIRTV